MFDPLGLRYQRRVDTPGDASADRSCGAMSARPDAFGPAGLRFTKMHGAGNDFVVIDRRAASADLSPQLIEKLCDRRRGVGCDQLLSIEPARSEGAALAYGIWNADGSAAGQCGNGARCVAAWALREGLVQTGEYMLDSPAGPLSAFISADHGISIDMPRPQFSPQAIPLRSAEADSYRFEFDGESVYFAAVSLGNPHAVIEVDDVDTADVARVGPGLQNDPRFPDRCNVGFAQIINRRHIRLRVYERGVGETLACGSGACAAVAVLRRRGLLDERVSVTLPGGTLDIVWPDAHAKMRMSGPTAFVFEGEWHE